MTEAMLGVDSQNPTGALGLYERLGFEVHQRSIAYERPFDGAVERPGRPRARPARPAPSARRPAAPGSRTPPSRTGASSSSVRSRSSRGRTVGRDVVPAGQARRAAGREDDAVPAARRTASPATSGGSGTSRRIRPGREPSGPGDSAAPTGRPGGATRGPARRSGASTSRNAPTGSVLFRADLEPEWLDEGVAEADIHQPRFVERDAQRQVVESGPESTFVLMAACLDQVDLEADRAQEHGERAVELVTEPAATEDAQLVDERVRIELHAFAEHDAGVLERDGPQVRGVQGPERLDVGAERSAHA